MFSSQLPSEFKTAAQSELHVSSSMTFELSVKRQNCLESRTNFVLIKVIQHGGVFLVISRHCEMCADFQKFNLWNLCICCEKWVLYSTWYILCRVLKNNSTIGKHTEIKLKIWSWRTSSSIFNLLSFGMKYERCLVRKSYVGSTAPCAFFLDKFTHI